MSINDLRLFWSRVTTRRLLIDLTYHLTRVERQIATLTERMNVMALNFDALAAEVARNTSVDESAVTAIAGLNTSVQELRQQVADLIAAGSNPAEIQAKIDEFAAAVAASNDKLAAAIPANTPAQP